MSLHKTTGHDRPKTKVCKDCPSVILSCADRCPPCSDAHRQESKRILSKQRREQKRQRMGQPL